MLDERLKKIEYEGKNYFVILNDRGNYLSIGFLKSFWGKYEINESINRILKIYNAESIRIVRNLLDGLLNDSEQQKIITFRNEEDGLNFVNWLRSVMIMGRLME